VAVERCNEGGIDAEDRSDANTITAREGLPARWTETVSGLTTDELQQRPLSQVWSIAEYADHVSGDLFGTRFLPDTAVTQPGTVLRTDQTEAGSAASVDI
jgi:hypothetical protein